jgi:hypothetical protein
MGTDIHGGFIRRNKHTDEVKVVEATWDQGRHYLLFAILADVRNGFGFAGVKTFTPIEPITSNRGLPSWWSFKDYYGEVSFPSSDGKAENDVFIGDHSFTHMNVSEILAWPHWDLHIGRTGVLNKKHYLETLAVGKSPEGWSGDVWGQSIIKVAEEDFKAMPEVEQDAVTHVMCSWEEKQSLAEECDYFLDEVKRIASEYPEDDEWEEVLLVIGFDS